jgi:hypothetical protein
MFFPSNIRQPVFSLYHSLIAKYFFFSSEIDEFVTSMKSKVTQFKSKYWSLITYKFNFYQGWFIWMGIGYHVAW